MARHPLTNEEVAITAKEHHDSGNYRDISNLATVTGAATLIAGGAMAFASSVMNEDAPVIKTVNNLATGAATLGGGALVAGSAAGQYFRRRRQVANDRLLRADVQLPAGPNTGMNDYVLEDGTRLHPPTSHGGNWAITLSEERSKQLSEAKEPKR